MVFQRVFGDRHVCAGVVLLVVVGFCIVVFVVVVVVFCIAVVVEVVTVVVALGEVIVCPF